MSAQADNPGREGPLKGIRVLDFSRVIAGPLCTQQLADMGAEVIKIENPQTGDDTRRMAHPGVDGESHFFLAFNRSKQSLALDVRRSEGRAIARRLAAESDVLVQNFRPGVMARLGLDYASLARDNPGLVYLSISAYGQEGAQAHRPGFDPVMQAESGMMAQSGEPDGPPLRHPLSIIDTLTALQGYGAVCAALYGRRGHGRGCHIDLSLMDTAVAALGNLGLYALCEGTPPARTGNAHSTATPVSLFETQSGPIYLATATDRLFGVLCRDVLQRPELSEDPRFVDSAARLRNRPALLALLQEIFLSAPREVWLERMRDLPAGAVRSIEECLADPDLLARGMVQQIERSGGSPVPTLRQPARFDDGAPFAPTPPPRLGEHTDALLTGLAGLTPEEIGRLREDGTVR